MYVSRLSDKTSRHARHVFKGVSTAWTWVDTSLFPEGVPEIDAHPEHERLNLYTRALYCFFVDRHVGTSTTRHA